MNTPVDERLRLEVARFSLRFGCEHCAHFAAEAAACAHGYPCEQHRDVDLETATELSFCKEFELV